MLAGWAGRNPYFDPQIQNHLRRGGTRRANTSDQTRAAPRPRARARGGTGSRRVAEKKGFSPQNARKSKSKSTRQLPPRALFFLFLFFFFLFPFSPEVETKARGAKSVWRAAAAPQRAREGAAGGGAPSAGLPSRPAPPRASASPRRGVTGGGGPEGRGETVGIGGGGGGGWGWGGRFTPNAQRV